MKRILASGVMLVAVLAVLAGGTGAFFSDTETSTGNVFTAGAIDLTIDHTKQTYNGVDCQTCSVSVYSSEATKVISANAQAVYQGPFPVNAQLIANPHPNWLPEASVVPAEWIWVTPAVSPTDVNNNAEYTFEDKFFLQGPISLTSFNLSLAADNGYKIVLNGFTIVDKLATENNYNALNPLTGGEQALFESKLIQNGQNVLQITVRNKADANSNPNSNPAGLIYKIDFLNDDCEAGVADFQATCELWQSTDLTTESFFNFSDVKPQDSGTNLISMTVNSNEAYMCLSVNNQTEKENNLNNPEATAGDVTPGALQGEMGQYLMVAGWYSDVNGVAGDLLFAPIAAENIGSITFADGGSVHAPLQPGDTEYVKLAWCLGDLTVSGSTYACDGDVPNINQTQTDAFLADLQFYAVQSRNNSDFRCVVSQ